MQLEHIQQLWGPPPEQWELAEDEIHIWSAALNPPAEIAHALEATLSPDERENAARLRFPEDQQCAIVARGILRQMVSVYVNIEAARVEFCYGPHGKPALWKGGPLEFNLSHSGKLALYAVARRREVGVDLERVERMTEAAAVAERFFSEEEKQQFQRAPLPRRQAVFFEIWTHKEAILKCTGRGIADAPVPGPVKFEGTVSGLMPAPGYIGALAARGDAAPLRMWSWPMSNIR